MVTEGQGAGRHTENRSEVKCGEWARARGRALLRLTEHADQCVRAATGIVMRYPQSKSRSQAMGQTISSASAQFLQRLVCSASGGRGACSRHARPKRRFAVALGRLASPHWQRKKVLRTVHALPSHQTMPHYSPSCKYIQLSHPEQASQACA